MFDKHSVSLYLYISNSENYNNVNAPSLFSLSDIEMFTSVHQDPQFTKDPFKAVALALENRVLNAEY